MKEKIKSLAIASALSGAFAGISVDTASATEMKEKWELNRNEIMIVGKYFNSNNDHINCMKVCKKYEKYAEDYHFNPISDMSLFPNVETQHFYEFSDAAPSKKLQDAFQYIVWFNPHSSGIDLPAANTVYKYNSLSMTRNNLDNALVLDANGTPTDDIDINLLTVNTDFSKPIIFDQNNLEIILPCGISEIGDKCFCNIKNFSKIKFNSAIRNFGNSAFENTDLEKIVVPEGTKKIGPSCFKNCDKLTDITLPSTLRIISLDAFMNTSIKQITIPNSVYMNRGCFTGCNQLINLRFPVQKFNYKWEDNIYDVDDLERIEAISELGNKTIEIILTDNNVANPEQNDNRLANEDFLTTVNRVLDGWFGLTKNPNLQRKNIKSIKILN